MYPLQAPAPGPPQEGAISHEFVVWQVEEKGRYARKSIKFYLIPRPAAAKGGGRGDMLINKKILFVCFLCLETTQSSVCNCYVTDYTNSLSAPVQTA